MAVCPIEIIRGDRRDFVLDKIYYEGTEIEYQLSDTDKIIMEIRKESRNENARSRPFIHKEFTVADVVDGHVQIIIYPEDTNSLDLGDYVYDMRLVRAVDDVRTIIEYSPFIIKKNVSVIGG